MWVFYCMLKVVRIIVDFEDEYVVLWVYIVEVLGYCVFDNFIK